MSAWRTGAKSRRRPRDHHAPGPRARPRGCPDDCDHRRPRRRAVALVLYLDRRPGGSTSRARATTRTGRARCPRWSTTTPTGSGWPARSAFAALVMFAATLMSLLTGAGHGARAAPTGSLPVRRAGPPRRSAPGCWRSTARPTAATGCRGTSLLPSTRSTPISGATSASRAPGPSAGCSSCRPRWSAAGQGGVRRSRRSPRCCVRPVASVALVDQRRLRWTITERPARASSDARSPGRRRRMRESIRARGSRPQRQPCGGSGQAPGLARKGKRPATASPRASSRPRVAWADARRHTGVAAAASPGAWKDRVASK